MYELLDTANRRDTTRIYTQRVQTVLTAEQYALLRQLSKEQEKPVSVLIREAVERVYFKQAALRRRRTALKSLLSLNAPVADWEQMEEEITKGALDG